MLRGFLLLCLFVVLFCFVFVAVIVVRSGKRGGWGEGKEGGGGGGGWETNGDITRVPLTLPAFSAEPTLLFIDADPKGIA